MAEPMRALTIKPPWSEAIRYGTKRVENRSWPAPAWAVGQDIAIHAGKSFDRDAMFPRGHMTLAPGDCVLGAIVAVARLTGCHDARDCVGPAWVGDDFMDVLCSPWSVWGEFHWLLAAVRPLPEPVPCRGMLGLWRLPEDVESAAGAQLKANRG